MLPDRVSNPGPLTYESGALPIALRGPACWDIKSGKSFNNAEKTFGGRGTILRASLLTLLSLPSPVPHSHKKDTACYCYKSPC